MRPGTGPSIRAQFRRLRAGDWPSGEFVPYMWYIRDEVTIWIGTQVFDYKDLWVTTEIICDGGAIRAEPMGPRRAPDGKLVH